jgi:hypothetical protein
VVVKEQETSEDTAVADQVLDQAGMSTYTVVEEQVIVYTVVDLVALAILVVVALEFMQNLQIPLLMRGGPLQVQADQAVPWLGIEVQPARLAL